jgi:acetyl esterase
MMNKLTLLLLLVLSPAVFAETPSAVTLYKTTPQGELKLHIFNPPDHTIDAKAPAIVFFFGGGWTGGSPKQFYPQSAYLATRGMVAISAEYRVAGKHKTSPKECVKDGKSAIRWVRANAAKLGVDPQRVAGGGGSAGGHVAAATGTVSGLNEEGEDVSVSCIPDALVLFNPVYHNGPGGYGHERVKAYWESFSPLHNLNARTPPTIVFLGTKDSLIPVAHAELYKTKMEALKIRSDLHLYAGEKHGFFNKSKYVETVVEMDKFLASLGFLKGEPTLTLPKKK